MTKKEFDCLCSIITFCHCMKNEYTSYTFIDFLSDSSFLEWRICNSQEQSQFWNDFIDQHPEKKEEINKAISVFESVRINDGLFSQPEKEEILENIKWRIKKKKKSIPRILYQLSIASSVLILFGLAYIWNNSERLFDVKNSEIPRLVIQNEEVQLIQANNKIKTFDENSRIEYNEEGELITGSDIQDNSSQKGKGWNKLIVPKGRRSFLLLADGSRIHVNSGSVIEFPSIFEDNIREIRINGEVYIEATKNAKKPFVVTTSTLSVKVLGTRFNVSAYPEEEKLVVLVEGSVEIHSSKTPPVVLKESELYQEKEDGYSLKTVDTSFYTSWINGFLKFRHEPLISILNKISRYYNVEIECTPSAQTIGCSGKLVLFEDVITTINNIAITTPISYSIENNKIKIDYEPLK